MSPLVQMARRDRRLKCDRGPKIIADLLAADDGRQGPNPQILSAPINSEFSPQKNRRDKSRMLVCHPCAG
jgi:hypothetical protein